VLAITVGGFSSHRSVWLAALGLVLALVGLFVATGESVRHPERAASLTGAVDEPTTDVYHPPGSRVWMTP
jgi:hypothetical protein